MHEVVSAVAKTAGETAAAIRAARGGPLRRLAAWIGWNEGLLTLRSIAASLRLRSEGHVSHSNENRRCDTHLGLLAGGVPSPVERRSPYARKRSVLRDRPSLEQQLPGHHRPIKSPSLWQAAPERHGRGVKRARAVPGAHHSRGGRVDI